MAMKWSDSLSVGVAQIDDQHKSLIDKINSLLGAMAQGKGKDEIDSVIGFLADYVVTHFGDEEKLMVKHVYPDMKTHKAQHAAFIQDFKALKSEFDAQGASSHITMQVQRRVCDWLIGHIGKTDKALGAFLKTKM